MSLFPKSSCFVLIMSLCVMWHLMTIPQLWGHGPILSAHICLPQRPRGRVFNLSPCHMNALVFRLSCDVRLCRANHFKGCSFSHLSDGTCGTTHDLDSCRSFHCSKTYIWREVMLKKTSRCILYNFVSKISTSPHLLFLKSKHHLTQNPIRITASTL